jgi:hypothetical protein
MPLDQPCRIEIHDISTVGRKACRGTNSTSRRSLRLGKLKAFRTLRNLI